MKYSIIIPVYNTEKYIRQCVDSVLEQSFHNIEIILVDDGSSDRCRSICEEYAAKDKRVVFIHQDNSGPGIARNKGIDVAKGDYILFLDSDDFWLNQEVLETIDRQISGYDLAVFDFLCYADGIYGKPNCDCHNMLNNDYETGELFLCDALRNKSVYAWSFPIYVFNKRLFFNSSLRFTNQKSGEDIALLYRIILQAERVKVLKCCMYAYRQERKNSSSKAVSLEMLLGILGVVENEMTRIQNLLGISEMLKERLLNAFCEDYFFVLTALSRLPRLEKETVIENLERLKWAVTYSSGKDRIKTRMVQILGVRFSAQVLEIKRHLLRR